MMIYVRVSSLECLCTVLRGWLGVRTQEDASELLPLLLRSLYTYVLLCSVFCLVGFIYHGHTHLFLCPGIQFATKITPPSHLDYFLHCYHQYYFLSRKLLFLYFCIFQSILF